MSSPRVRKIADRIQVIVAQMLERRIKDPRLGFVTITDVRLERQGRHQAHAALLPDLGPQHPLGGLERDRGGLSLGVLAQDGVVDRGVLAVTGEADIGHGDEPEPRVLDPSLEHLGDDHLDPVGDLADPRVGHSQFLSVRRLRRPTLNGSGGVATQSD